jgi:hypothetical protein
LTHGKKTRVKLVSMNMSKHLKTDLLPKLRARYERRGRAGKTRMLDELCEDYGYERKYAIKLLGDSVPAPSGRAHPGPEPRYALIEPVVRAIWLAAEQPCGKRLAPALQLWLPPAPAGVARALRKLGPLRVEGGGRTATQTHSGRGGGNRPPCGRLRSAGGLRPSPLRSTARRGIDTQSKLESEH